MLVSLDANLRSFVVDEAGFREEPFEQIISRGRNVVRHLENRKGEERETESTTICFSRRLTHLITSHTMWPLL